MQRRFSKWVEQPGGPLQVFLVYLTFILLRLQVEMLFLDPNRSLDFFIFNIWYFFSLLLSIVLLAALLTGEHPNRLFRLSLRFSAVILIPLLDRIFYPSSTAEELLPLCRLPLHADVGGYLATLFRDVLGQRVFLDAGISAGLRLEVFLAAAGLAAYVFYRSGQGLRAAAKGVAAYALCLTLIYAHGVLVVHPGTRRWVFIFFVLLELILLFRIWHRELLSRLVRRLAWAEFALMAGVTLLAFRSNPSASTPSGSQYGCLGAALVSLLFLAVFIGLSKQHFVTNNQHGSSEQNSPGRCIPTPLITLASAGALLAGFLAGDVFFTTCAALLGMAYLLWLSPLRLGLTPAWTGVCGALAVWVVAWGGYFCAEPSLPTSPMPIPPMGMRAPVSMGASASPQHGPPTVTQLPIPPAFSPQAGPLTLPPQPSSSPFQGPPLFPGLRTSGTAHPDWLFHPFWLALPALLCGLVKLSAGQQAQPKPADRR